MKNKLCIYSLLLLGLIGILFGCKEKVDLPIVTTSIVTEISDSSATCGGTVISDGGSEIIERGVYEVIPGIHHPDTTLKDIDSHSNGSFTVSLTGLSEGTAYVVWAYATNSAGITYGNEIVFSTHFKPVCGVSDASQNSIVLNGYIYPLRWLVENGNPPNTTLTSVVFEYGTSTSYGEVVTAIPSPITIGHEGDTYEGDTVNVPITGLAANAEYHYRLKASNSEVTIYSQDYTFRTLNNLTASDIDDNVYNTVTIGTQVWMVENLKVTKYNDGTSIPLITDDEAWGFRTTPAYCWPDNDEFKHKNTYGALYKPYTVSTGKLCPTGWHVPTKEEWETLEAYLGGCEIAAYKLKDFKWRGSNSSSFSAQMSGERVYGGSFNSIDFMGWLWLATEYDADNYFSVEMSMKYVDTWVRNGHKSYGRSVRCLKD